MENRNRAPVIHTERRAVGSGLALGALVVMVAPFVTDTMIRGVNRARRTWNRE